MYSRQSTERPSDIMKRETKEKKKPKPNLSKLFVNKKKTKGRKKNKRSY